MSNDSKQTSQSKMDLLTIISKMEPGADADPFFKAAWRRICGKLDSHERRGKIIELVHEALSQIRLDVKALQFDLEATRRERDELAQRLKDLEG